MDYERKMVREKDVKFDDEDGSLELTDIRIVWIKKPSKWGGAKKFGAIAGSIAAAAAVGALGDAIGGGAGRAVSRAGRHMGYAAVGIAITSWNRDSYYNKDKDGNTESIAVPLLAISQAAQSGDRLICELKSGGTMDFKFKKKKVISSIIANITSAQNKGKCPYCGANAGNVAACPKCGAPIEGGGDGAPHTEGGSVTVSTGGDGAFCTNCGNPNEAGGKFCGKCGSPL